MQVTVKKYFVHLSLGLVPLFIVQERSIITAVETTILQKKSICNLKSYLGRKMGAYSSNPSAQSSVMLTNTRTLTLVVVYRS